MSYGKVEETFWHDPVIRALPPSGRDLLLYLLTCPHKNRLGCFVLDPGYAGADLQWDTARVNGGLQELHAAGRIAWDPVNRVVFLRRFLKHNTMENALVVKGAISELRKLPDTPLLPDLLAALETYGRPHYRTLVEAVRARAGVGACIQCAIEQPIERATECAIPPVTATATAAPVVDLVQTSGSTTTEAECGSPFADLLPDHPEAVEALGSMKHPNGQAGTATTLRTRFLYSEGAGMPEPCMKGLSLERRRDLAARTLLDMQDQRKTTWGVPLFVSFVERVKARDQKRQKGPDFGNETQRDTTRRREAQARQHRTEAERREQAEREHAAKERDLNEWLAGRTELEQRAIRKDAKARVNGSLFKGGKMREAAEVAALMGAIEEARARVTSAEAVPR